MQPTTPDFDAYAVLQVTPTAEQEVVRAAFRALAMKYHPDREQTIRAQTKMALLNRAWTVLRDVDRRAAYDRSRRATLSGAAAPAAAQPTVVPPPANGAAGTVLQFGRYRGWALRDIARHDPEYLVWLARHSSGAKYRAEIDTILRSVGRSAA